MAKYLKLFMVALFATMTFTLTSCGDDEDDPKPSSKVELTIDGVKHSYDIISGDFNPGGDDNYDGFWILGGDESKYGALTISIPYGDQVEEGGILGDNIILFFTEFYHPQEGDTSIKVKTLDRNSITLVFSNTKMVEGLIPYQNPDYITVDGTITLPFPLP